MGEERRFVTQKDDDGGWRIYDRHRNEFVSSVFDSRRQAVARARIYQEHVEELQNKR
ncbi:hypothetical protein [Phytoactinopolyspora halotolerans]|uniref:AP2/ERF domain-containing protein n=1 Tax=Phytoactinopolyspora halotolerans TaxID=1981512 RepID=A0A6L9SAE4_9ACTN|nr:hypothetical protein [Phytoactinopolyspora halotolerans]NEE00940.1 hypothetical protein [Phytoactinopolyspora halotolerans]